MEVSVSYVLIVVGWLGGAVNGAAVSTQEFTSAERCETARLALVQDAKKCPVSSNVSVHAPIFCDR